MPTRGLYRNRVPYRGTKQGTLGHYSMLELYEGKLSRTVLRRGNGGNSVPLAGALPLLAIACHRGRCQNRQFYAGYPWPLVCQLPNTRGHWYVNFQCEVED